MHQMMRCIFHVSSTVSGTEAAVTQTGCKHGEGEGRGGKRDALGTSKPDQTAGAGGKVGQCGEEGR